LAFVPEAPEILFATPLNGDDYYGVYRSIDGGSTWHRYASNPVDGRPVKMAVQVGDETNLLILYDGDESGGNGLWKLRLPLP
jgi:hypothetical protein